MGALWHRVTNMFLHELGTGLPTRGHGSFASGHWRYCSLKLALMYLKIFFQRSENSRKDFILSTNSPRVTWCDSYCCDWMKLIGLFRPMGQLKGSIWMGYCCLMIGGVKTVINHNTIEYKHEGCRPSSLRVCLCLVDVSSGSKETNTLGVAHRTHMLPFAASRPIWHRLLACRVLSPTPFSLYSPPYLSLCPHLLP